MVGVTPGQPSSFQTATRSRIWLISRFSSIRSRVHCVSNSSWRPRTFAAGIGMKYELTRRDLTISFVIPVSPNAQWRVGATNGEFKIGFSITASAIRPILAVSDDGGQ